MFSSSENGGGWWFIIIILLILLWNGCGGMGWGRGNCGGGGECAPVNHAHQTERDVLNLGTVTVQQNADIQKTLAQMAYAQQMGVRDILDGQKDLYIRDLERVATQQFITGQTELLANKMDNLAAMGALQRQADQCSTNARLAAIESGMLKAPPFTPFGGMPLIGCANVPGNGCGGCGGWGFQG